MLFPNRRKYKKEQKGNYPIGVSIKCNKINFGSFAIKAIESGILTVNQIESTRRALVRKTKKLAKLWIRVFANIPVSKKPIEVRMGKGKGAVDHWVCKVKAGRILFELDNVNEILVKEAFEYASNKLPIKTILINKIY